MNWILIFIIQVLFIAWAIRRCVNSSWDMSALGNVLILGGAISGTIVFWIGVLASALIK